jgi:tRNA nucleotidyltransferase (CCA-adding enzyme)
VLYNAKEANMTKEIINWMSSSAPADELRSRRASGWLAQHMPEVDNLYGVAQPVAHHPEVDTGIHTELVLEMAARLSDDPAVRFAALCHDLGKGLTPVKDLPQHWGHERAGVPLVVAVTQRLALSTEWRELAMLASEFHLHVHRVFDGPARTTVRFFRNANLFERPHLVEPLLLVCEADARGRAGLQEEAYPQRPYLMQAFPIAQHAGRQATEAEAHAARIHAVAELRKSYPNAGINLKGTD